MWSRRDPSQRRNRQGNVFVKNLDKSVTTQQLHETFGAFGRVASCKIETDDYGVSKGFGYVQFESEDSASKSIISSSDGSLVLAGKSITVCPFVPRKDRSSPSPSPSSSSSSSSSLLPLPTSTTTTTNETEGVYVRGIDPDMDEEKLARMFEKFGEISSTVVLRMPDGSSRCCGFCNFKDSTSADRAISAFSDPSTTKVVVLRAQKRRPFPPPMPMPMPMMMMDVYVSNMDEVMEEDELRMIFSAYGMVVRVRVMREEITKQKQRVRIHHFHEG